MNPIRMTLFTLAIALFTVDPSCSIQFATVTLSPGSLTFSPQVVSTGASPSAPQSITVTAGSAKTLTISAIDASGEFSQTNDCPGSLSAGGSCTIQVIFAPNSIGAVTGAITLTSNAIGGPHIVSLIGTGLSPVGFSPATLDFGNVGVNTTSSAQTLTLTNNQNSALGISAIAVSGDYSQTNNCTSSLAAGQSCQISVRFKPTLSGIIPGALSVATDASPGTQPVALTGVGTGSVTSNVSFSSATLAFADQEAGTSSAQKTITLTNKGSSSVTIQSVGVSADYTSTDNCAGAMLSAGGTCSINVIFQPIADFAPVTYPGTVTVVDSDATSPQVIGLNGNGVAAITSTPSTVDFGNVLANTTSAPQNVTFKNNDAATEGIAITPSGGFALGNSTCSSTLPAGKSCKTDIAFTSSLAGGGASGPLNGALTVTPSSGGFLSPQVVNLKACITQLLLSPPRFDFGAVSQGSSSTETLTIYNPNQNSFNVSGIAVTGQNAGDFVLSNDTCTSASTSSCTVDVTYTPQASGLRSGVVTVTDDDGCSPHQENVVGGSSAGPFTAYVAVSSLTGGGSVTSNPAGITCDASGGTSCSAAFASGTTVTLTAAGATSQPGTHLSAWSGACSGSGTCTLGMDGDKQVTATFVPDPQLIVAITGSGAGSVVSSPAGITCDVPVNGGTNCVSTFPPGASVKLTATAASGSTFGGWSGGGCSGMGTCTFTSSASQTITATFSSLNPPDFSLTASALSPATVKAGQSATGTVRMNSINGFNGTITFSCSVQPARSQGPTCSVTPTASGATVTIATTAPSHAQTFSHSSIWFYAVWIPFAGLVRLRKKFRNENGAMLQFVVVAILLGAVAAQVACGGGATKNTSGGTPAGNYTIGVTGTSGALQHSTKLTLTVQ
jgi:ASPM-SPD-2-Hydin domain-containing protein/centrosomal CEP192-like protein/List-Bact-rpt repeat protein